MAEVERVIAGPLAKALEAGRPRFNALFAQARRTTPRLDAAAFADHLRSAVAPAADAVAAVAPDRVAAVVEVLYELSLDLVGKELLSRYPAVAEGWRALLAALPRQLALAPRPVAGSVTNALCNLSQIPGARPHEWTADLLRLGPRCPDVAALLELGKVAAWRAGMAHFRDGALESCRHLPPELSCAVLGLPEETSDVGGVLDRLQADPWLDPAALRDSKKKEPQLRVVATVGGFRGFGGPFLRPPRVALAGGQFLVGDGEECWVMTSDVFGATLHRAGVPFPEKANGLGAGFVLTAAGKVTREKHTQRFDELRDSTSAAASATTLAVTVPLSHRVFLVALQV